MKRSLALLALAVNPAVAQVVSVKGIAWDSLRSQPLAGALVSIAGTERTAIADAKGRFQFDSLSRAAYTFTMQHDVLDSIGLSARSMRVEITKDASVSLGTPSFGTLWRAVCGGPVPVKDTGFVYGSVRDLKGQPLAGATVRVRFIDYAYTKKTGFNEQHLGGETKTDSTGRYAMCGVPSTVALLLKATKDAAASGEVEVLPTTLRVLRRSFQLGAADTTSPKGTVMGSVTNADGQPLYGAIISTEDVPEVRTGENGRFIMRDVPAGTRQFEMRAIGASPATVVVDVVAGDTTEVTMQLSRIQTLAEVNVRARTFQQVLTRGILERQKLGLGLFRDSTTLGRLNVPVQMFDQVRDLDVIRDRTGTGFRLMSGSCTPAVWVDRMRLDDRALATIDPQSVALIEFYDHLHVPVDFMEKRGSCGAVVVWTKRYLKS